MRCNMTYEELVKFYPCVDLFLELFKGLAPTIVAVLAIIINNSVSARRDKKANKINKEKKIAEGKITVLNEMLDKYIKLSQLFWMSGTHLILYLSCTDSEERKQKNKDFEQSLYEFQFKSQEIYDYFASMMKQYDLGIGCDSSVKDANRFANELITICEKYDNSYEITNNDVKNEILDKARDEIKDATIDVKAWTNVIMVEISKKIKELYEQ